MNVDNLHDFYGTKTDSQLGEKITISKSTISKWRANGIPAERQAVFQIISYDALEADLSEFNNLKLQPELEEA